MVNKNIFNYESLVHATAGATASIVALTAFYPLDIIKFRMQLDDETIANKTTLEAITYILKNEGIDCLYKGIKPVLISLGVSNFVYFYAFYGAKTILPRKLQNLAQIDLILSTIAGIVNVVITNPLWVVNNRLKTSEKLPYNNLINGVYHISKTEGISALWASMGPSLILVSNPSLYSTIYEALKRRIKIKSTTSFFLLSALSKTISTIITYPIQLAQTKQRTIKSYDNINSAALIFQILKDKGPSAIFQGLEAKLWQTVVTTAFMFVIYEKIARFVFRIMGIHSKLTKN